MSKFNFKNEEIDDRIAFSFIFFVRKAGGKNLSSPPTPKENNK